MSEDDGCRNGEAMTGPGRNSDCLLWAPFCLLVDVAGVWSPDPDWDGERDQPPENRSQKEVVRVQAMTLWVSAIARAEGTREMYVSVPGSGRRRRQPERGDVRGSKLEGL